VGRRCHRCTPAKLIRPIEVTDAFWPHRFLSPIHVGGYVEPSGVFPDCTTCGSSDTSTDPFAAPRWHTSCTRADRSPITRASSSRRNAGGFLPTSSWSSLATGSTDTPRQPLCYLLTMRRIKAPPLPTLVIAPFLFVGKPVHDSPVDRGCRPSVHGWCGVGANLTITRSKGRGKTA